LQNSIWISFGYGYGLESSKLFTFMLKLIFRSFSSFFAEFSHFYIPNCVNNCFLFLKASLSKFVLKLDFASISRSRFFISQKSQNNCFLMHTHIQYVQINLQHFEYHLQDYSAEELKLWVKNLLLLGNGKPLGVYRK
jgi:hypothetical protein